MKIEQNKWTGSTGWQQKSPGTLSNTARLALVFGAPDVLKRPGLLEQVKEWYPQAHLLGCSTAGEIQGTQVSDDCLVLTAIEFEHTEIKGARIKLQDVKDSYHAGETLAKMLEPQDLIHAFILSDGSAVNGSELVSGLTNNLPKNVTVTGGLAGDGARFKETFVFWDSEPATDCIAILGFYGNHLKVGYGSLGGWDPFGPERLITKSDNNKLYELDGNSALELYKQYLGNHAKDLPASALLFPLSLRSEEGSPGVVRTILTINEEEHCMVFAGDMPEGAYVRFMKANFDRLVDGAVGAAKAGVLTVDTDTPSLAILISCVGRKLVLKQRIEEEVEAVEDILHEKSVLTGFYSYGEISPFNFGTKCELHNQTMTVTIFTEQ